MVAMDESHWQRVEDSIGSRFE